jgi:3-oxoacyl-(acyl-carrier-protein) synthase
MLIDLAPGRPLDAGACDALKGAVAPRRVRHVVNNAAGFGGYNSSVVLAAC